MPLGSRNVPLCKCYILFLLYPEVRTLFGVTSTLHNLVNWRVGRILIDISVLHTSVYPTSLKRMVSRLGDIKAHYRTLAVPMPSYAMATLPVFALAAGCSAWEAVNYCDGDGGSIVAEQFPGLSAYLQQQYVTTPGLAAPWCTLVQVRLL